MYVQIPVGDGTCYPSYERDFLPVDLVNEWRARTKSHAVRVSYISFSRLQQQTLRPGASSCPLAKLPFSIPDGY